MKLKFLSGRAVASAVTAAFLILGSLPHLALAQMQAPPIRPVIAEKFQVLYPGIYTPREAALVRSYLDQNRALIERGPIDVQKLIHGTLPKDTPGVGEVVHATEAWVRYNNGKYDPTNPLRVDSAYARKSGFKDIVAYPTFGTNDDVFMIPYPPAARDTLLVSDLNHSVTSYRPIYPGDTLYPVANSREVIDLTPAEGSIYRSLAINTSGSVYNQRGEKVNDVIFRVTESIKIYKDPNDAPKNPGFFDMWEAPDWLSRPAHFYTDADWMKIRDIWAHEIRRGAEPLYWDDVKVGDQPAWTLDGPVEASVSPVKPWGMGAGGSRTMEREIMDPKIFSTMIRGAKDGIYRLPNRSDYIPTPPPQPGQEGVQAAANTGAIDTTDIHKEGVRRSPLVNYMGREFAIRHLTNWMGDRGWLENISWSIMDPRAHANYGKQVPANPRALHYLDQVPFMRGKFVSEHGLTGDVAIVKSYLTKKYVRDGKFMVDLVWWIENIDGQIWEEGSATIRLPSRKEH
jgi:hypothetical protein